MRRHIATTKSLALVELSGPVLGPSTLFMIFAWSLIFIKVEMLSSYYGREVETELPLYGMALQTVDSIARLGTHGLRSLGEIDGRFQRHDLKRLESDVGGLATRTLWREG